MQVRKEPLQVQFDLTVEVLGGDQLLFKTSNYKDLPGPEQGASDRANIFHNRVIDRVKKMSEHLKNYMNKDTSEAEDNLLGI